MNVIIKLIACTVTISYIINMYILYLYSKGIKENYVCKYKILIYYSCLNKAKQI